MAAEGCGFVALGLGVYGLGLILSSWHDPLVVAMVPLVVFPDLTSLGR